ncbi:hypothetical protein Undi14_00285 [Undibacterium sp. 14-3-2]|uniref:hypothetical protein n=1 Tax=Undibacterium sp. 14-3-2 TaxID=2800129 RepID=UPI0019063F43|nr:hypothetical protein [Undibacterium sp. 14-3-2]MBK1888450.1 hypothetical protein [Undibacterium sp. 14-3-2]
MMGAWGTGLYSDDTSCDVRDDYVTHLTQGCASEEAEQKILDGYGPLLAQPEIACCVYFALADAAWKYGRLSASLKAKALSLLQSGGDIFVWQRDAPANVAARIKVLKALEARLNRVQPPELPMKLTPSKPQKVRTTAPIGSVFSLVLPSGNAALLILVGYKELAESIDPVFSALSWRAASVDAAPHHIAATDPTLPFNAFRKQCAHVAILPGDQRRNILFGLEQTSIRVEALLPYNPESIVWLAIGRIAREIDAFYHNHASSPTR